MLTRLLKCQVQELSILSTIYITLKYPVNRPYYDFEGSVICIFVNRETKT